MKKAVIFGGSGFIGRHIVCRLVAKGYHVYVVTRSKDKAARLKLLGNLGQVEIVESDLSDIKLIARLVSGCDAVVNLLGTINEMREATLKHLHVVVPHNLAKLASEYGKKYVHFSAMGIDLAVSAPYAKTKLEGEQKVQSVCKNAIIIRPNLVFGDEDNFFHKFARLSTVLPFLFTIGKGDKLLQPVYVGDLAEVVVDLIENCSDCEGIYEICGPKTYSSHALMRFVLDATLRKNIIIKVPHFLAKVIAVFCEFRIISFLLKPLTGSAEPVITRNQLELLKHDIVACGLYKICSTSTEMETIMTEHLKMYAKS